MKSIVKMIFAGMVIIGIATSAVAANNNTGSDGTQTGNAQGVQQGNPQGEHPGGGPRRACRSDAKKFCEGIKPGEGRIIACLKENLSKLTPACAEKLAKAPKNGQAQEKEPDAGSDE